MKPRFLIVLAVLVTGCAEESALEPRPWEFEVPEDLPTHIYAPVSNEDRAANEIQLIEDLVIGSEDDPNSQFGFLANVAVGQDGRIYVPDQANHRVQVFDSDGQFLATLGREGEGPGEMMRPRTVIVAAETVFVASQSKISLWSAATHEFQSELKPDDRVLGVLDRRPDGRLVMSSFDFEMVEGARPTQTLAVRVLDGPRTAVTLLNFPVDSEPDAHLPGGGFMQFIQSPRARPLLAAGPDSSIYYTFAAEHQVMAVNLDGVPQWALQVPVPRPVFDAASAQEWGDFMREAAARPEELEPNPPSHLPSIGDLRVDGHGRLHVYHFHPAWRADDEHRRVDVYDASGSRVVAGLAPAHDWSAALGDHVYGTGVDPVTEEYRVYRWRMAVPDDE